ncbi:hypothetical protein JKA74_02355 [Marivirga sp. S37H4]|uniref:Lipocalin-like domain-containing protein n=1 Tax=Marivirga aurantiaca TaxID=2802615 RepID=A0A934WVU7_9BACT|nr:hypothetical protein [Marivirga aurantiaca]MBK6263865.1 hypothetical protein [Marivirga aurantiaca]
MKSIITVCLVLLLITCVSCQNDKDNFEIEEGTYQGVFYRFNPESSNETANVTLTLSNNEFEGTSDAWRYPLICEGSYKLTGREITFTNTCGPWTADFDWTLILNNKFEVERIGDKLILTLNYNYGHYDRYELEIAQ